MKVTKDKVVEIHYTLTLDDGQVGDSTEGEAPLPYLHGAGNIIPGLEAALDGRDTGEKFSVTLTPEQGYGLYDEALVEMLPLSELPEGAEVAEGDEIFSVDEEGVELAGIIERLEGDNMVVNYNHPLAGRTLTFNVEVVEIRDATPEELEHGHAHDPYADEEGDWDDEEWDDDDEWEDEDDDEWEDDEDEDAGASAPTT
mgnify:CR=1 FL=1